MQKQSNELNFNGENIYIGIDVHLKSWYVVILTEHIELKRSCINPDAKALAAHLHTHFPGATYYSVYEAGFCGTSLHYELESLGIHNIVVNPSDVPCSDKEREGKTDAVDAGKLARELRNGGLPSIYIHKWKTLQDRSLLRARSSIVTDLTRVRNRIKGALYFHGVSYPPEFAQGRGHWSKRFMAWLTNDVMEGGRVGKEAFSLLLEEYTERRGSLLKATRMIRDLSRQEPYRTSMDFLRSVHGIGILTGMFLLTNIEDVERFASRDNFAGYLGLKPSRHQSAEKDPKGHLTNRGQKELRTLLIESSWIAVRKDPALTLKFSQLCRRMEPNKAIINIAHKLANRIYYVLKNKQYYVNAVVK